MSLVTSIVIGWLLLPLAPRESEARAIALTLPTQQVTTQQLQLALHRVGLTPETLTAAGVSSAEQVSTIVNAVKSELVSAPVSLLDAEASVGVKRQAIRDFERQIQAGEGSPQTVTALAEARTTLATATSARDAMLEGLFNAGTFTLSAQQRQTLSTIRTNARSWSMPTEFLCVNRSESAWVQLSAALAHERIALKRNTAIDAGVQSTLNEARSAPAVAAAASNLTTHLASVRQAWQLAVTINS